MSSDEIEDVLSSIRRLVAQDVKTTDHAKPMAEAQPKLVLAPELRISDAPAPFSTVRQPGPRMAFQPVDMVLPAVAALTDTHARSDDDDANQPPPTQASVAIAPDQSAPADWDLVSTPKAAAILPSQSLPADPQPAAAVSVALATESLPQTDSASDALTPAENAAQPSEETSPPPAWREGEPDDIDTFHIIEAGQTNNTPDQALQGTIEPDADWADAAEQRVIAELAGETIAAHDLDQIAESKRPPNFTIPPQQDTSDLVYDEAQLRLLVQTILREELAGALGERITRNIRKLVRAEVGRMMAVQELE